MKPIAALVIPFALAASAFAHPVPDIPVRGFFGGGDGAKIEVEVDARCFAEDPENTPYLTKAVLDNMDGREKAELIKNAQALLRNSITFHFDPAEAVEPSFSYRFTTHGGADLEEADAPVMVTGTWKLALPNGAEHYRVEALPAGKLSVVCLNHRGKDKPQLHVLFPGETSATLELPAS